MTADEMAAVEREAAAGLRARQQVRLHLEEHLDDGLDALEHMKPALPGFEVLVGQVHGIEWAGAQYPLAGWAPGTAQWVPVIVDGDHLAVLFDRPDDCPLEVSVVPVEAERDR